MSTKVDAALARDEERFADDPERQEMLRCVRRFKASWIELGRALTDVRKNGRWRDWGFETFEAYAKTELRLRQDTVDKLTGSFMFLEKRAPNLLREDAPEVEEAPLRMPSYQAIDFLRRAEERADAPPDAVRALYTRVMDEGASLPQLKREFESQVFPMKPAERRARDAHGIRNVASRLRTLIGETDAVPKRVATRVSEALEELLAAVQEAEAA
jgi:hypothetical protein